MLSGYTEIVIECAVLGYTEIVIECAVSGYTEILIARAVPGYTENSRKFGKSQKNQNLSLFNTKK